MEQGQTNIAKPIKELLMGKAAIAGLLRSIAEQVTEVEKTVESNQQMVLCTALEEAKGYLAGICNGLVADSTEAQRVLNICKRALGEEVEDLIN